MRSSSGRRSPQGQDRLPDPTGEGEWHETARIRRSVCRLLPRGAAEPGEGGRSATAISILGVSDGGLTASETVHAHPQVESQPASPRISQGDPAGRAPGPAGDPARGPVTGMVEEDV